VSASGYVGRFAPTPSGPLHFGSLIAALGSWLDARAHGGRWLLRIDDHDAPRCVPGATEAIPRQLEAHGLHWDDELYREQGREAAYAEAFERLRSSGRLYPCACTRRDLDAAPLNADGERIYPGTCRDGVPPGREARAWRVRVNDAEIGFTDSVRGAIRQQLARDIGDFTVRRADGLFAYQLLCAVDDIAQGITHVVRGGDLLGATARQIFLMRLLDHRAPSYAHLPVAVNRMGQKLSKQSLAPELAASDASANLWRALDALGQCPPRELTGAPPDELLAWGTAHWSLARVPRTATVASPAQLAENAPTLASDP
jgi:glutamyl-Q tRNA(Asp) synthetase